MPRDKTALLFPAGQPLLHFVPCDPLVLHLPPRVDRLLPSSLSHPKSYHHRPLFLENLDQFYQQAKRYLKSSTRHSSWSRQGVSSTLIPRFISASSTLFEPRSVQVAGRLASLSLPGSPLPPPRIILIAYFQRRSPFLLEARRPSAYRHHTYCILFSLGHAVHLLASTQTFRYHQHLRFWKL